MQHLPEQRHSEKLVEIFAVGASHDVAATPYAAFAGSLAEGDLAPIEPIESLRLDPEIGGYLKRGAPGRSWTGRRLLKCLLGLIICCGALAGARFAHNWNILQTYTPPQIGATPKPLPFAGDPPLQFQETVKLANADIRAGNRWSAVFERLKSLAVDMDDPALPAPRDLRLWLYTEMLVAMASKELPPGAFDDDLADRTFADMAALPEGNEAVPARAAFAYARLLHAREVEPERVREGEERLLSLLERIRGQHGQALDQNPEMLAIEAEHNIAALPEEYRANDRYLEFHWRRAAHAINRLYQLAGPGDRIQAELDRRRWEKVYSYFDFTLLTLSYSKLGRIEKVTLDGRDYTRDEVRDILRKL